MFIYSTNLHKNNQIQKAGQISACLFVSTKDTPVEDQKTLRLILGDQLNLKHSWFAKKESRATYLLMEMRQETDYVMHHIQKITAFFASMRRFSEELKEKGHKVIYLTLDDPDNSQSLEKNISQLIQEHKFTKFEYQLPDEYRLDRQLKALCERLEVECNPCHTDHFLTKREDVKDFFKGKKQYLMESFYRHMRKKHGIFMEGDKPYGGKWNYDRENRGSYDGKVELIKPKLFNNDVSSIVKIIKKSGVKTFGEINPKKLNWPVNRKQALAILRHFTGKLLPHFGTYQDAMIQESRTLFHSRLSFALNTKMLHPMEVINAVLEAWERDKRKIGIHNAEGFIRQILGWREFMRGIYWAFMPEYAEMNHFNHRKKLPHYYWDGDTKMNCMSQAIGQSLENAYAHHIQRLMVTGNFALLAGIDPNQVDAWYLGVYIDAIEWVEITNTRGMSQYADGGMVATKPYVSSANYIHKMSDYCKSCHYDHKKKTGEKACPFNSLYWEFYERNRKRLEKNPRAGMMYRTWDKMNKETKKEVLEQAKKYKSEIERL
ncbi:MAG: cryptochrome/photolyase family protein [candidate division Zixibacteria bacterium]|nr:cryptochrome/photolyase family protein [candidate division Zixibacteria bacterium]